MANKPLKEQVIKVVSDKVNMSLRKGLTQDYVEELKDRIVKRTRVGIGVDLTTGKGERLKKLSDDYKRQRKRAKGIKVRNKIDKQRRARTRERSKEIGVQIQPNLSSKTTPSKSNLTATGQLLDSLTVIKLKLRNAFGFRITVGDRRGRDLFGRPSKIGNKKLVQYLAEQGRTFLGFTKSQRNIITKEIRNILIKGLK